MFLCLVVPALLRRPLVRALVWWSLATMLIATGAGAAPTSAGDPAAGLAGVGSWLRTARWSRVARRRLGCHGSGGSSASVTLVAFCGRIVRLGGDDELLLTLLSAPIYIPQAHGIV